MKTKSIFLFITKGLFFFLIGTLSGQENNVLDTTEVKEKYGLRVGLDLVKLGRNFWEEDYQGLEVTGDYRVYKNWYAAAEIGLEKMPFEGDNIKVTTNGQFIKLGVDYNAYTNWKGMNNMIYAGFRYGFSTFSQSLDEYAIYGNSQFFGSDVRNEAMESSGLIANWIELVGGLKVELINNLYLSANVQLKRRLLQTTPEGFDNLTIPGFNRTYDDSSIGVGYGYTLSYLIPIFKK